MINRIILYVTNDGNERVIIDGEEQENFLRNRNNPEASVIIRGFVTAISTIHGYQCVRLDGGKCEPTGLTPGGTHHPDWWGKRRRKYTTGKRRFQKDIKADVTAAESEAG